MPSNVLEMIASLVVANFSGVEFFVIFEKKEKKLYAISAIDVIKKKYNSIMPIKKVAEIKALGNVKLIGVKDFMAEEPMSGLEAYIEADHNRKVLDNFDVYIASYIHLYRNYKSLAVLMQHKYVNLIDTFIDHCMVENTDHPATIAYSNAAINEVLKFRKATYTAIKKYLVSHKAYMFFLNLHKAKYTDKQFRQVRDIIKTCADEYDEQRSLREVRAA